MPKILFKEVESPTELEQIHALNHRVFAEEIAQHPRQPSGMLVDRFDTQNRYFVAVADGKVIGMISAHGGPEFSVTRRLPDPGLLQSFERPAEVRLLAIDPEARNRTVLAGLLWQVYDFAVSDGFSHLLISGISERERMYRKLGFFSLGPAVAEGAASFIPMAMAIGERNKTERVCLHERRWNRFVERASGGTRDGDGMRQPISLMPGPVCIHPRVARAWASPPVSHRSAAFTESYEEVRAGLNRLVEGMEVTIFPGAGTLANDAVAANLKAIFGHEEGLVLSNGEFGERIAKQATCAGLRFKQLKFPWGKPWSLAGIEEALERRPAWVWAVHLETSTGVLNDISRLQRLAADAGSSVALDCVSSLGAAPIANVGNLLLASGVSGKALASYAGLAFAYLSSECRELLADKVLCPSYDLLRMHQTCGPLTTVPSPLLFALASSLEDICGSPEALARRLREHRSLGEQTRRALRRAGLTPLAAEEVAAPTITTFTLPSPEFPWKCLEAGYQIAHESSYLQKRGWGQIATMGSLSAASLAPLFDALSRKAIGQMAHA